MNPERLRISVLYAGGQENPEFREVLQNLPNLKFFRQAVDPETFVAQHEDAAPDLVLVDLDGMSQVPDWLEQLISRMPRAADVVVCSRCRDPDFLIRIMKLKVGAFVPLPLQRRDLEEVVEQIRAERLRERSGEGFQSQLVLVTGTKGGVGTTAIAVNLAIALAELSPGRIVLMDMARPFPQVSQFLDIKADHTLGDLLQSVDNLDPLFLQKIVQQHKSKLGVIVNSPEFDNDSPALMDIRSQSKIFTSLRAIYSWIVVDAGVWLDYLYVNLIQEADQVLLITELSVPGLQNLKRLKSCFRRWDLDESKVKVVVNRYERDYTLGLSDLENIFLQPAFYTLPSDYASLIEAINQGTPLGEVAPRSKLWRRIKGLAAELVAQTKPRCEARPGLIARLFQRG